MFIHLSRVGINDVEGVAKTQFSTCVTRVVDVYLPITGRYIYVEGVVQVIIIIIFCLKSTSDLISRSIMF